EQIRAEPPRQERGGAAEVQAEKIEQLPVRLPTNADAAAIEGEPAADVVAEAVADVDCGELLVEVAEPRAGEDPPLHRLAELQGLAHLEVEQVQVDVVP